MCGAVFLWSNGRLVDALLENKWRAVVLCCGCDVSTWSTLRGTVAWLCFQRHVMLHVITHGKWNYVLFQLVARHGKWQVMKWEDVKMLKKAHGKQLRPTSRYKKRQKAEVSVSVHNLCDWGQFFLVYLFLFIFNTIHLFILFCSRL